MTHSEKCPICFGAGKIAQSGGYSSAVEITCHGCQGRGWIEVRD